MFWQYDCRLGRRWNLDPFKGKYPSQSPYATFNNNPIIYTDPLGLEGKKPNIFQRFKAVIGIGKISGTKKAGNQHYVNRGKHKASSRSAGADDGAPAGGGIPQGDITGSPGGGVGPGQSWGRVGTPGPNPRSPQNPWGIQSRLIFGMQRFWLPGGGVAFPNGNNSVFNRNNAPLAQAAALQRTLSTVTNRDAYNVEANEIHIYVIIHGTWLAAGYTLRDGTIATNNNQILDDRAQAIRSALLRLHVPNNKIVWDRIAMGQISGSGIPMTIPSTSSGRFAGQRRLLNNPARNSSGVVLR